MCKLREIDFLLR